MAKRAPMMSEACVRISGSKSADDLVVKANERHLTMRTLAELLADEGFKTSQPHLSQARRGTRPMPAALAKRIKELTGFAATKANWPDLRADK